ncbi:MAG: universal stress protein [Chloroflexi bacterium]|nr:universal stress protein [Chloroflexota bacterium]
MYQSILVPLDGSRLAEGVLPYVENLARGLKCPVTLLHVADPAMERRDPAHTVTIEQVIQRVETLAKDYLRSIAKRLEKAGVKADGTVLLGHAYEQILRYAEEHQMGLIAMSTHARAGLERWVMGSVTTRVMTSARIPLLLFHPLEKGAPPKVQLTKVIVPLDGSPLGEAILAHVENLASRLDLEVILVQTLPVGEDIYLGAEAWSYPVDLIKQFDLDASGYLTRIGKDLSRKGFKVNWDLLHGRPADEIIALARRTPDNLVAMSTRGRSGAARWALGSVADQVARSCGDPVLLVRPPETR